MNQGHSRIVRGNNPGGHGVFTGIRAPVFCLAPLLVLGALAPGRANAQEKHKVPVIDKLSTTTGPGQQAFSGSVQSLDLKTSILEVRSTRDDTDEYFPFKKTVHVASAGGQRLTLDGVKLGWNVLVYFEDKDNRRTVKEIVVLGPPEPEPKKSAPAPPS
jgi:hypothetical protein